MAYARRKVLTAEWSQREICDLCSAAAELCVSGGQRVIGVTLVVTVGGNDLRTRRAEECVNGAFLVGLTYRAISKRFAVAWDTAAIAGIQSQRKASLTHFATRGGSRQHWTRSSRVGARSKPR